jgi:hypothetical protein
MARSVASGVSGGLIRAATYNHGRIDWSAIAADAFGNAFGNSIVGEMQAGGDQVSSAGPVDPTKRNEHAIEALTKEAEKYGGFDKIPSNSPALRMAMESAKAGNEAVFVLAKSGEAGMDFAGPINLASADADQWKAAFASQLKAGARDLAISGGVIAGMFQTVGDGLIGAGTLLKDVLLAQQYMLLGGDRHLNRAIPGFELRREGFNSIEAVGQAVADIAKDPGRYIGDVIGRSVDEVASRLRTAQDTDALGDWFLYGASVGNITMGVASVIAGAAGAARLATASAREVTSLLRTRIDKLAPDVRANPIAPELSRGMALRTSGQPDFTIPWGKGIEKQGFAWENRIAADTPSSARLPANFKTFDFFDDATGTAISAKTVDTMTSARLAKPEQIYSRIKRDIDAVVNFDSYTLKGVTLSSDTIAMRELRLAIPGATANDQWLQVQRAIQYGQQNGVTVRVTRVPGG